MPKKLPEPIRAKELVEIFVPSECRCGQPLPEAKRQEVLDEVIDKLTEWFPGATGQKTAAEVKKVDGYWKLVDGSRADEKNDLVYANCSAEELEEHFEDVQQLAHGIAIRLTQEVGACRINGEFFGYEESLKSPHRCAGELPSGALPTPLGSNEKKSQRFLQAFLGRVSNLRDIKDLFCKHLNYEHETTELATPDWPEPLQDLLAINTLPEVIAGYNGFKIIHLQLAAKALRKGQERQLIQRIRKDDPTLRALFVVSNFEQDQWHLINTKDTQEASKTTLHLRFFRIGKGQQVRTAAERLHLIDIEAFDPEITAQELQEHHNDAFDVESVSQDFFNEISNWYFWALSQVEFPQDTVVEGEEEKHRATSLIRFLTRIIFCWFLKEKGLIPESLFNRKELEAMLVDLEDDHCTYHQGILQNLFFATLNQRMGKDGKGESYRRFITEKDFQGKNKEHEITDLYHYPEHFLDPEKAPAYFKEIPFLNGGLFECLDREDPEQKSRMIRIDGFTTKGTRARIPNNLFFASKQEADLSGKEAFGSAKYKKAKVRGLLNILHAYNFTVEENTPVDEEIALDPELLGKVFENLLATYNIETQKSARENSGSFYTPRPIVDYMVDESLKGYLVRILIEGGREAASAQAQLTALLGYEDQKIDLSDAEREALLNSIHSCKILDPACGSGAFPMGMLQKLLHVVQKLDEKNEIFERIQIAEAQKITDRDERLKKIEKIGRDFADNNVDYARKLYLIENCLFGVDIQPIAIQISKLRFFISLICDQKTNKDKGKNHGVEALPNLETKIVAANTLISLPDFGNEDLFLKEFTQPIEKKIEESYHRYFSVQNQQKKRKIQTELRALREQLGNEILQNIGAQESAAITEKARSIAKWDPFDAQASSDFFDARWMFGKSLYKGFNIVIGNPPYVQVKKGIYSSKIYPFSEGMDKGKQNLYKVFVEASYNLLAKNGISALIVQSSLMCDLSSTHTRELLLDKTEIDMFIEFPKKSKDKSGQVFKAVLQGTCICIFTKKLPACGHNLRISINNNVHTIKSPKFELQNQNAIKKLYPEFYYIPLISPGDSRLINKIKKVSVPFSNYVKQINQGDLNLTSNSAYFSTKKSDIKLYRGENVGRFELRSSVLEFVDGSFKKEQVAKNQNHQYIVIQEITGTTDQFRLHAALTNPLESFLFGHTANKILLHEESLNEACLGIMNSRLLDWIFRKTSTNNHVMGYEIMQLPFIINLELYADLLASLVRKITSSKLKKDFKKYEAELNEIVYKLYGLSASEVEHIDQQLRS